MERVGPLAPGRPSAAGRAPRGGAATRGRRQVGGRQVGGRQVGGCEVGRNKVGGRQGRGRRSGEPRRLGGQSGSRLRQEQAGNKKAPVKPALFENLPIRRRLVGG